MGMQKSDLNLASQFRQTATAQLSFSKNDSKVAGYREFDIRARRILGELLFGIGFGRHSANIRNVWTSFSKTLVQNLLQQFSMKTSQVSAHIASHDENRSGITGCLTGSQGPHSIRSTIWNIYCQSRAKPKDFGPTL
jgi:hypothetical protein